MTAPADSGHRPGERAARRRALSRQRRRRLLRRVGLGIVVLVVPIGGVAAYAHYETDHVAALGARASATTTTSTTLPSPLAPLTGLPALSAPMAKQPAVIVKIDNDDAASPQSGIDQADVVYEEVVEGGITRFLAVFQSQDADVVGPVRSVRETDADIVRPIGGLFAYSGGIAPFVSLIDASGVTDVGAVDDGSAYYRSSLRAAPDNLYTSTTVLRERTPADAGPPPALFDYVGAHQAFSEPGATRVSTVTVDMSSATIVTWSYDSSTGQWLRSMNGAAQDVAEGTSLTPGPPIAFTNVIVQMVPYQNTGYVDPAGNPVPDATVVGSGPALVLSGGKLVHATWSKPTPSSITTYETPSGSRIRLLRGQTWVMLAPSGAAVTTT
jgi:Protein of unknown function (DUF3048) N-terminal domain/Protein of unknown function (DUF3048) C-terminal domain